MTDVPPPELQERSIITVSPRDALAALLLLASFIGGWIGASLKWGWLVGLIVLSSAMYVAGVTMLLRSERL